MTDRIDLSKGLTLTDDERAGLHKALADLDAATGEAERRVIVVTALHIVQKGIGFLPIPATVAAILSGAIDLALTAVAP